MNNQPTEDGSTVLERWKALARIENSRARENWDAQETNVQSDLIGDIGDSENKTVRKRRDERQGNLQPHRIGQYNHLPRSGRPQTEGAGGEQSLGR